MTNEATHANDLCIGVLDISLDVNWTALLALLRHGGEVEYFDHHFSGAIPEHPNLRAHIDTAPEICTSEPVDWNVGGEHRLWAIESSFIFRRNRGAHPA